MKKSHVFISLLLILFLSVGTVCATDAISDDFLSDDSGETLEITDYTVADVNDQNQLESVQNDDLSEETILDSTGDTVSDGTILDSTEDTVLRDIEEDSFTQLSLEINNSADILEITHDYKFYNDSDNANGIRITKNNFIVNGNNHIIDGNNLSAIFHISGINITINNLILKNANSIDGSALYIDRKASLTTNNVTFVNNTGKYGVVELDSGRYVSNDDKFLDCAAPEGVIFTYGSDVIFNNALMASSMELTWGFIRSDGDSFIAVFNSTFANTTSKYSTAIKGDAETLVENCMFINLHATLTAGAIALKTIENATIRNCTFNNVTSEKNGGAIFVDAYTSTKQPLSVIDIYDSNFVDCFSQFGGAILQLEGILNIDNCNFTNNGAFFDGGAIYTSFTGITLTNSKFVNNTGSFDEERGGFGGSIYADSSVLTLNDCEFIDNAAQSGGAIYLYDTDYIIENNLFRNNLNSKGNFDDIYTAFDSQIHIILDNELSSKDSLSLDNELYEYISETPGMKLIIINNSIDVSSIPAKFDLRDWGWITPVRDQGMMGCCWAFSTTAAMESAILRYLGIDMDISENNVVDVSLKYSRYGATKAYEGGNFHIGANYALSWLGVFSSEYDSYDELGKISPIIAVDSSIHFQDMVTIRACKNASDINHVKEALLKYGALAVTYFATQSKPYYNSNTGAQYCNNASAKKNHGVTLIGWDDSYSKDNFLITPPGDGAWIFKNSWGEKSGVDGYYYISYYDTTFLREDAYALVFYNDIIYNKNYQYDLQGYFSYLDESNEYRNNFVAIDDDLIAAVGTYFNDTGVNYTVEIYVNDELRHVQSGLSPFAGYHTIKLDSYIPIKKGEEFTVKIKSNAIPVLTSSRQHYVEGSSEYLYDGTWKDVSGQGFICCIKAYTVADDTKIINNKNISVDYDGGSYFSVKVVTANGHAVGAGAKVKFTINGKTSTVKTDKNGIAKIKIVDIPKKYTITTDYNGKTYKNTVTVKQVLKSTKFSVKNTDKKLILKATLKINGKAVKGKTIKFKFRGKTYSAKTNANGIATVTIKQSVIKKLTGKSYAVKVTYLKDTIKTSVTVKQVLKASKATVKKTAKKFNLKASLKINGKVAKAKTIKFTLLKKTYKVKTNKKGIAIVTIKKAVIKKLKKGKTYSVKVSYGKDSVKTTVKVK